ncbi:MAG TPA: putative lipid II flippase FtsW [Syntrophales bacterium]|jgi:cell division protein FtsW|nr:putative lipid II flippase FtsW [Syntrophales bacterium]HRT61093.1 putative lipid II flippase FtsW [Syntrophales bacterium]
MIDTTPRKRRQDFIIIASTLTLIAFGTVMIYSSSYIIATQKFGDGYYFLKKQVFFLILGLTAMICLAKLPYTHLRKAAYGGLAVSAILLIALFIPGLGAKVGGARRWLRLGVLSFQVSEFVKVCLVIFLAHFLAKKADRVKEWRIFVPPLLIVGILAGLVLKQPDFGTAVLMVGLMLFLLYLAGCRLLHLGILFAAFIPAAVFLVWQKSYRLARWKTFLDPWQDPQKSGFQIIQSFLSFGSGGAFGVGLGDGMQKLFYLPEPHTDFILSIIGEETGLIGIAAVITLFAVLICRGFMIAFRVPDLFGSLLASGLTILIAMEAFINIAGVMGLVPTKGMALPFVSYGGTSLIMSLALVGILLNLSTYQKSSFREAPK